MKSIRVRTASGLAALSALLLMVGLAGCTKQEMKDTKETFMTTAKEQVDAAGKQIEKMKSGLAELGEDAKKKWNEMEPVLEEKMEAARKKLAEAQDATGEAWEDAKSSFQSAIDDLKKAINDMGSDS